MHPALSSPIAGAPVAGWQPGACLNVVARIVPGRDCVRHEVLRRWWIALVLTPLVVAACGSKTLPPSVSPPPPAPLAHYLGPIGSLSDGTLWVVGGDEAANTAAIYISRDDGAHWQRERLPDGFPRPLGGGLDWHAALAPQAPRVAWAVSPDRSVYQTVDAGGTWMQIGSIPPIANETITGMAFDSGLHGWAAAAEPGCQRPPELYETVDGGRSWHAVALNSATVCRGLISGVDAVLPVGGGGLAVTIRDQLGSMGIGAPAELNVELSADGGRTWSMPVQAWSGHMVGDGTPNVAVVWPRTLWLAAGTHLRRSDDGGVTWSEVPVPVTPSYQLVNVSIGSHSVYVETLAAGECGPVEPCEKVLRSKDGRAHWEVVAESSMTKAGPTVTK